MQKKYNFIDIRLKAAEEHRKLMKHGFLATIPTEAFQLIFGILGLVIMFSMNRWIKCLPFWVNLSLAIWILFLCRIIGKEAFYKGFMDGYEAGYKQGKDDELVDDELVVDKKK